MRVVQSVAFTDEGVVLTFLDTSKDVRNRELLMMSHQLLVRAGEGGRDYDEEIEHVRHAARMLLDDALEDWEAATDVGVPLPFDEDLEDSDADG